MATEIVFVKFSKLNHPDKHYRINVHQIVGYGPTGGDDDSHSMIWTSDNSGVPFEVEETPDEIDRMLSKIPVA